MNRNLPLPDLRNRLAIDAARVIGPVAQQNQRSERQCRGIRESLADAVSQARSLRCPRQLLGFVDSLGMRTEAIQPHLKPLPQFVQHAPVQRSGSLLQPSLAILPYAHA